MRKFFQITYLITSITLLHLATVDQGWAQESTSKSSSVQESPETEEADADSPDQENSVQKDWVLPNGGMETSRDGKTPQGWRSLQRTGVTVELDDKDPVEGKFATKIDALELDIGRDRFASFSQSLDAKPWRGKKVRFRAAVKTSEMKGDAGGGQLWLRVDRTNRQLGAFDNMQNRPIRGTGWEYFEIVVEVAEDAEAIHLGLLVTAQGVAWIDDASFESIEGESPVTDLSSSEAKTESAQNAFQMPEIVMKARREAVNAPEQPFFTHWLWLALLAMMLFLVSGAPSHEVTLELNGETKSRQVLGWLPKFAIRFSFAYWFLYSFFTLVQYLLMACLTLKLISPSVMSNLLSWYPPIVNSVVYWFAENIFGITDELVPPNGSGDTTFNFIQLFAYFSIATLVATVWSLIDRRKTDYRILKDVLVSFLAYTLAAQMMTYGLMKAGWSANQFPLMEGGRLDSTWGDSSPMGALWKFMGSSRSYTIFAGLGEVIGGILVVFRRTRTLGALISLGVMVNVMMLNFCFDVPVKLFSTHLVWVAICVILPDAGRLLNILFWNKNTQAAERIPPYTGPKSVWVQRAIKAMLVVLIVGVPVYGHLANEINYARSLSAYSEYFGSYKRELPESDSAGAATQEDETNPNSSDAKEEPPTWTNVTLMNFRGTNYFIIRLSDGGQIRATFEIDDESKFVFAPHNSPDLPVGETEVTLVDDGMKLSGKGSNGDVEVVLRRVKGKLLMSRGFRWINETPFNR